MELRDIHTLLVAMQINIAAVEKCKSFLKIKNRTTIWSSISTSGYLSKETKNTSLKIYMYPHIHCSLIYNSQDTEKQCQNMALINSIFLACCLMSGNSFPTPTRTTLYPIFSDFYPPPYLLHTLLRIPL